MSVKGLTDLPMAAESTKVTSHVGLSLRRVTWVIFSILVRRYVVVTGSFWI
jgi:hypothetical protein